MLLYLVQHGTAVSKEENPDRTLSEQGKTDVEKVAFFLESTHIDKIYHSGKARAAETAEIFGMHLHSPVGQRDGLSPMDEPSIWAEKLRGSVEDIMLVGHLPHMARLASLLLCGDGERGIVEFVMGGVVCLKSDEGRWSVRWMVTPDLLV